MQLARLSTDSRASSWAGPKTVWGAPLWCPEKTNQKGGIVKTFVWSSVKFGACKKALISAFGQPGQRMGECCFGGYRNQEENPPMYSGGPLQRRHARVHLTTFHQGIQNRSNEILLLRPPVKLTQLETREGISKWDPRLDSLQKIVIFLEIVIFLKHPREAESMMRPALTIAKLTCFQCAVAQHKGNKGIPLQCPDTLNMRAMVKVWSSGRQLGRSSNQVSQGLAASNGCPVRHGHACVGPQHTQHKRQPSHQFVVWRPVWFSGWGSPHLPSTRGSKSQTTNSGTPDGPLQKAPRPQRWLGIQPKGHPRTGTQKTCRQCLQQNHNKHRGAFLGDSPESWFPCWSPKKGAPSKKHLSRGASSCSRAKKPF